MNSGTESLYIGIVSGILTSALIYLVISIFEKIILPWYQTLIYRGTDISGEWVVTEEKVVDQIGVFNIEQKAHKITGTATWIVNGVNTIDDEVRIFNIEGQISERFVTLTLKHKDKRRLGISSYLVQIIGDGRKMQGFLSFYNIMGSNIVSSAVTLARKEK